MSVSLLLLRMLILVGSGPISLVLIASSRLIETDNSLCSFMKVVIGIMEVQVVYVRSGLGDHHV